jgi:hypothetical protein
MTYCQEITQKQIDKHKKNLRQIIDFASPQDYKNKFTISWWQPNYFIITFEDNFKLDNEFFKLIESDYNLMLLHHLGRKTQFTLTSMSNEVEILI